MPGTFSQLVLHIVFSTKHRQPWIDADLAAQLYPYLGGIVRAAGGVLHSVGGVADHVHLCLRWRPDVAVSDLLRDVKSRSTKWVRETFPERDEFAWQEGYSAFSVSKSQEAAVKRYITRQVEHHRHEDLRAELLRLLTLHEVPFEERYVVD